jgi:hypothetical protein
MESHRLHSGIAPGGFGIVKYALPKYEIVNIRNASSTHLVEEFFCTEASCILRGEGRDYILA